MKREVWRAMFPWGEESVPSDIVWLGSIHESQEVKDWCDRVLREGVKIHGGEPISESELSIEALNAGIR